MRRASAQTTIAALLVGRSLIEAVLFAAILTAAQVFTIGDRAIPIVTTLLALAGIGIVLASILRDARVDRQNTAIALSAMAAAAVVGLYYARPQPDGVMFHDDALQYPRSVAGAGREAVAGSQRLQAFHGLAG